jgi:disulfide bond formation protein DsbB
MAWQSRYKVVKLTAPVWLLWGGALAALMLLIAHGFEIIGHLAPCELCLHQREGYWAALLVGAGGYGLARWRPKVGRGMLLLLAAMFALETLLAAYHAGVEWKWWPGPASCTGVSHRSGASLASGIAALMNGSAHPIVQCDQAAWRLLGLSMAGWNAIAALALTVATLVALRRVKVPR